MEEDVSTDNPAERFVITEKVHHQNFDHLFSDKRVSDRLTDAVQRAHVIFETAGFLLKIFCTEYLTGKTFTTDVAKDFSLKFDLKNTIFSTALTVVCTDFTSKKKGRPFKDNILSTELEQVYQRYCNLGALPVVKTDGSNLSHILSYMTTQLSTAYKNNVFLHYDKYVKKYMWQRLTEKVISTVGDLLYERFTKEEKKSLKKGINAAIRMLLYAETVDEGSFKDLVGDKLGNEFLLLLPVKGKSRFFDLKKHPEKYLPYMIHINTFLGHCNGKLLSPNPFRSSFVTKHVTIDTAALVDIVVGPLDKGCVPLSELLLQLQHNTGLIFRDDVNKGHLYGEPNKMLSSSSRTIHQAHFKRQVWHVLSNLGSSKTPISWQGLCFNNLITTNGYKVDMHFTDEVSFLRKRFTKGEHNVREDTDSDFEYVHKLPQQRREEILESKAPLLGADPGKGNIIYINDGVSTNKGGKRLRYTAAQRRHETSQKRNRKELDKMLDLPGDDGITIRDHINTLSGPESSGKSSDLDAFTAYLVLRLRAAPVLRPFYQRRSHRRRQYRALLGKRSSEDRLIANIKEIFGTKDAIILWGNWGRNPNLKHQPPTPGVGLRRVVDKTFKTFTVDEYRTSSLCFACEEPVHHPKTRRVWKRGRSGFAVQVDVEIHHLLRCENANCNNKWWHRDNLGSLNIKKNGDHALRNGDCYPCFRTPKEPSPRKSRLTSRKGKQVNTHGQSSPVG